MKILFLLTSLLFSQQKSYSDQPIQTNTKVYTIHKTQRDFIKKENRSYLKKKTNQPQDKNNKKQVSPNKK